MPRNGSQFTTIRTEGGLLPASLLQRVAALDGTLPGLTSDSYHLAKGERFGEVVNRSWLRLVGAWTGLREALAATGPDDPATGLTRDRWLLILFQELGYGRLQSAKGLEFDGVSYPVSHEWANLPVHLVGANVKLDTRTAGVAGAARSSPHSLVQELLNRDPARLWGMVSNGFLLRILRDNVALTRQAYVEFDLEAMMDGEVYADFSVLWLLAHQSRVEADQPSGCWLERWSQEARTQGSRALEHIADGVEAAVQSLGSGFLSHAHNSDLRNALTSGDLRPKDLYRQLLRVVYRILFILVAEERDLLLLPVPKATDEQRRTYTRYYAMSRIRELAERRRGTRHADLWQQVQTVVSIVGGDQGCLSLALPALGSFLFSDAATANLNGCKVANDDLLAAMRALSGRDDDRAGYRWRFDYRNLASEELGSVYETLLDLDAEVDVPAGRFVLRAGGAERRSTGSHYTPTPILKKVLDFALEPAIGRALRESDPEAALLALRVMDPACGSGHFLIAVAHRIAEALASVRTGETSPPPEDIRAALRDVVARCLYGVDLNPMAVELCRVALWLETLDPGKPLSFLDHHVRVGNSLLGVPLGATVERNRAAVETRREELAQRISQLESALRGMPPHDPETSETHKELRALRKERELTVYDSWADAIPDSAFKPTADDDRAIARKAATKNRSERHSRQMALATVLVELPGDLVAEFEQLGAGAEDTVAEVTIRAEAFAGLQRRADYKHLLLQADTWSAAWFWPLRPESPAPPTQALFATLQSNPNALPPEIEERVSDEATARRFFHPELAFPEVFSADRGGFDVVLGNPPYLGGNDITARYGASVAQFLRDTAAEARGHTDLSAYFVRRAFDAIRREGHVGLITTDKITAADSRNACMVPITTEWGGELVNAVTSTAWEGSGANVMVAIIHVHRGTWAGPRTLDGEVVTAISPALDPGDHMADPVPLPDNRLRAFQGSNVLGPGFFVEPEHAQRLITNHPEYADVLFPAVGADEITSRPEPGPVRWVINFGDRSKDEAAQYEDCFDIVERLVRPQRAENNRPARRDRWWQFAERAPRLYTAIADLDRVIAMPLVSKVVLPVLLPSKMVFTHKLAVIALDDDASFAVLSSNAHWLWAVKHSSPRGTDRITYSTSDAFETFARPPLTDELSAAGQQLHEVRARVMSERRLGLTDLYNLVNAPNVSDPDVDLVRELHRDVDAATFRAYGWDLEPCHTHRATRIGVRYTLVETQSEEVIRRLNALNLQRSANART